MGTAAQAQAGRNRARERSLKAAPERRLRLGPAQLAREKRIDKATVDAEVAWEERAAAEPGAELRGLTMGDLDTDHDFAGSVDA